jgi:hypothetical protein
MASAHSVGVIALNPGSSFARLALMASNSSATAEPEVPRFARALMPVDVACRSPCATLASFFSSRKLARPGDGRPHHDSVHIRT